MDHPMRPVVSTWKAKIKLAQEHKTKRFGDNADEAMFFFHGPYDEMYGPRRGTFGKSFAPPGDSDDFPRPAFAMTVNKCAEMVQLFGPALYHKNPVRTITARKLPVVPIQLFGDPADPNVQQGYQQMIQQVAGERAIDQARASLLQFYLNYTPTALDLKTESRNAIDEALIKGMGTLWTEIYKPAGCQFKMIGSFYDTVDNLLIDPDMEGLDKALWIARRCTEPVWKVEKTHGLEPGSLKGNLESFSQQARIAADQDGDYNRRRGLTNDLLVYWKIYSKMGMGGRLSGDTAGQQGAPGLSNLAQILESYGDYCYLEIAEDIDFPLNVPQALIDTGSDQDIMQRVQWPTPFWADDSWPVTPIAFHWVPRETWPMSHLTPALGELKFINWAYSMLAGKVRIACRDFIAIAKSTGEDLKSQIQTGQDYTMIEVENLHGAIDQVVKFLQHPEFNPDIFKVIEAVENNFEKRVGLTELMYGMTAKQERSAAESNAKENAATIRPDDMASKVEDAMGEVSRKEALAARWHLDGNDIAPVMGPQAAQWWQQWVSPADPSEVLHQLEYRIEAGSARKPNKAREASNMQQAVQTLFQPLYQHAAQTGDVKPVNSLIEDWAKSIDLEAEAYELQPPPPQPNPAQLQAQQAQQEAQQKQQQGHQQAQQHQAELVQGHQKHAQEMVQAQQSHEQEMKIAKAKLAQAKKGPAAR